MFGRFSISESQANGRRCSTDLGKSRRERNWPIYANLAKRDALWVRARSQIARTRADFDRFSDVSEILETEMWSRRDLNPRPLRCERSALPAELLPHRGRDFTTKLRSSDRRATYQPVRAVSSRSQSARSGSRPDRRGHNGRPRTRSRTVCGAPRARAGRR